MPTAKRGRKTSVTLADVYALCHDTSKDVHDLHDRLELVEDKIGKFESLRKKILGWAVACGLGVTGGTLNKHDVVAMFKDESESVKIEKGDEK